MQSPSSPLSSGSRSADASGDTPTVQSASSSPEDVPAAPSRRYPDRIRCPPNRFAFSTTHTYSASFQSFLANVHSHSEPRSYREAIQHTHWQQALAEELDAL